MRAVNKGKKQDLDFVNQFIEKCVTDGINNAEDIVALANQNILEIDKKIKEVEELKKIRPKLLDVISTFNSSIISNNKSEASSLSLYNISNKNICSYICLSIKEAAISIRDLDYNLYNKLDLIFTIKQLLENKVISKHGEYLLRGDLYDLYVKDVMKQ